MTDKPTILTIVGPTASGKTDLARRLATVYNGELVSADSRQVYRGLDLGTGKEGDLKSNTITSTNLHNTYPILRYLGEIPQWLIDIAEPQEKFTVADYQKRAYEVIVDILKRDKLPILVGGTGLYLSAVTEGYDFSISTPRSTNNPRHAAGTNYQKNPPKWNIVELGIDLAREELYGQIDQRLLDRLQQGMVAEAEQLHKKGLSYERMRQIGLEYRYLADHLEGLLTYDQFVEQLQYAIHRFARRQLTWWRHHGKVRWIKDYDSALALLNDLLP